jgi:hypothetical protein
MKTYVEFIRPSKKIPAGIATNAEVSSRDPEKLEIPASCDIFYFYDSPIGNAYFSSTEQYNCSKMHIVARKLLTRDEAKELIAPRLKKSEAARIIWDAKLENNRLFALTRNNNIEVVTKDNIVVDADGQRLWPKSRAAKTLNVEFSAALERDISVKKPVRFRQKPPQP